MTLENISLCENGNIELCDNGNIAICQQPAPCTCPCTTWPGAYPWDAEDEPCGGLLDEYDIVFNCDMKLYSDSGCASSPFCTIPLNGTVKVRAYNSTSCYWRNFSGGPKITGTNWEFYVTRLRLYNCLWTIDPFFAWDDVVVCGGWLGGSGALENWNDIHVYRDLQSITGPYQAQCQESGPYVWWFFDGDITVTEPAP